MPCRCVECGFTPKSMKLNQPKTQFQLKLMKQTLKLKSGSEVHRMGFEGQKDEPSDEPD